VPDAYHLIGDGFVKAKSVDKGCDKLRNKVKRGVQLKYSCESNLASNTQGIINNANDEVPLVGTL